MDLKNNLFDVGDNFNSEEAADERNRRIEKMVTDDDLSNVFFDDFDDTDEAGVPEAGKEPDPIPVPVAGPVPEPEKPVYSAPPVTEPEKPVYSAPPVTEPEKPVYSAPPVAEPIPELEPVQPVYSAPPVAEPIPEPEPEKPVYSAPPVTEPIPEPEPEKPIYSAPPVTAADADSAEERYRAFKQTINKKFRSDTMERKDVDYYAELAGPILEKAGLGDKLKQICAGDAYERPDFRKQFLNIKRLMKRASDMKGRDK